MMHAKGYWPTRQKWHPDYHLNYLGTSSMIGKLTGEGDEEEGAVQKKALR